MKESGINSLITVIIQLRIVNYPQLCCLGVTHPNQIKPVVSVYVNCLSSPINSYFSVGVCVMRHLRSPSSKIYTFMDCNIVSPD